MPARPAASVAFVCDAEASDDPRLHIDGRKGRQVRLLHCHPRKNLTRNHLCFATTCLPQLRQIRNPFKRRKTRQLGNVVLTTFGPNSSPGKKTSHNIFTMVVSNSICVVEFGNERSFLCCPHQSSLFASLFPTAVKISASACQQRTTSHKKMPWILSLFKNPLCRTELRASLA